MTYNPLTHISDKIWCDSMHEIFFWQMSCNENICAVYACCMMKPNRLCVQVESWDLKLPCFPVWYNRSLVCWDEEFSANIELQCTQIFQQKNAWNWVKFMGSIDKVITYTFILKQCLCSMTKCLNIFSILGIMSNSLRKGYLQVEYWYNILFPIRRGFKLVGGSPLTCLSVRVCLQAMVKSST